MATLGNDILSFIVTATICSILSTLVPARGKSWMQLLCGLVLTVSLIKPLMDMQTTDFSLIDPSIQEEADIFTSQGKNKSQENITDIITHNSQTYIMDKAAELGIHVQVHIFVNEETIPVPIRAELEGDVSPYARLQVEALIQNDLGIQKENIRWMQ